MRFQPPPGYQPVYNPVLPYAGPIYGGLKPGMSLYIQGTVHNDANSFAVNLQSGLEGVRDLALHFNSRFMHGEVVVMNSLKDGGWGSEERPSEMPFHKGESFQLLFSVTTEGHEIKVNGDDFHLFKHRVPVEQVCALAISGDLSVHVISINGGGKGHILGYPGLGATVNIPYVGPIYGGLKPGMTVQILGAVPCDVTRFHVSLQTAEAKCSDKALYINPRFRPKQFVVLNTFQDSKFDEQERALDAPFTLGECFELVIAATEPGYQVSVNGRQIHMFAHRIPMEKVLALAIGGDVFVKAVNIMGGREEVMAWPGPGYIRRDTYKQPIHGGLKEGMSLYLRGTVPPHDIDCFVINLEGGGDRVLHCRVQFSGWSGAVFNTQQNGGWGPEERVQRLPLRKGESFELVFYVTSEGYQVNVNDAKVLTYKHRIPLEQVTDLVIGGNVSVQTISIIRDEFIPGYPVPGDRGREHIQECPDPGDVSNNPFFYSINGGLVPGMSLYFEGKIHSEINRFHINLENAGNDIAMHFKANFINVEAVVFNSRVQGGWGTEETVDKMPFRKGEAFQLLFNVTAEGCQVIVNGGMFYMFKHRVPVDTVNSLSIGGNVTMETVNIIKEQGIMQQCPDPGNVKTTPYSHPIDGGLKPGTCLYLQGTVHSEIDRFHINLQRENEIAMHFKVNFIYVELLAFNTCTKAGWGIEERFDLMPFSKGQSFDLLINVTLTGYQVIVGGSLVHTYRHRMPLDCVNALSIGGDVSVQKVMIIRGTTGYERGGELGYNWRFLPMMGTQPIYNPPIPYTRMIPGGMTPGKTIVFTGKVLPEAAVFRIDFVVSSTGDIAMHFNPRQNQGSVVRNCLIRGNWGREERDVKSNPFQQGKYFEILVRSRRQKFEIFANGKHVCDFFHRFQPFTMIDTVTISGHIELSRILI